MLSAETVHLIKRLEIVTARIIKDQLAGQYHSVFRGRGMDFDEVQPYALGDDVRFVDWNVSARTGSLHVKKFVEERELTVLIAVDVSPSMEYGTWFARKQQVAAQIAMAIALTATQNKDRVGLVIFDDQVRRYIPPKKGRGHALSIVSALLTFERDSAAGPAVTAAPRPAWWRAFWPGRSKALPQRRTTNIGAALQFVSRICRRRAVVFMLSDFDAPDFERDLRITAQRHDLVPLVVRDATEAGFPDIGGVLVLRDLETGAEVVHDPGLRGDGMRLAAEQAHAQTAQLFRRMRLDVANIIIGGPTGQLENLEQEQLAYIRPLIDLFRRRSRRH